MARGKRSREHHWWPVGLQRCWTDRNGDVSWIDHTGKVQKKRADNRKIGYKSHGHTIFRGSLWETNFEDEFDIDNEIHAIVAALNKLKPLGRTPLEFLGLMRLFLKKDRALADLCKFYHLDEDVHRKLLLLMFSLLIRSPSNRSKYENYPSMFGLPPNEEVGKGNMLQTYRIARTLCQDGLLSNQYFILLHTPLRKFVCGDGSLDWLTTTLTANRISGRALVPLTPHLCVYFCTPMKMRVSPNCASVSVPPWMVDQINEITQIYSGGKLFFLGKPPKLTEAFRRGQFFEHKHRTDSVIDMLDEVAGNKSQGWPIGALRFR